MTDDQAEKLRLKTDEINAAYEKLATKLRGKADEAKAAMDTKKARPSARFSGGASSFTATPPTRSRIYWLCAKSRAEQTAIEGRCGVRLRTRATFP